MSSIYERADIYDLIEDPTRGQMLKEHWQALLAGKAISTILDVSIGTGSLTLPLCELGYQVTGSDLSETMLEQCRKKAEAIGKEISLTVCDFRKLVGRFQQKFDCVMSTGNSLPHVQNRELFAVLEQMDALIRPGGYLYLDTRNWEKIARTKQRFFIYPPWYYGDVRVNFLQVWDYCTDGTMCFNLLYQFEKDGKFFDSAQFAESYYPVTQKSIADKLHSMGYSDIQLRPFPCNMGDAPFEQLDWYCLLAKKH